MRGQAGFDRMAEQLNLTEDQKPKVQSIMKAQMDKMRGLRQDTSLTPEDRKAKMKTIREDTAAQMKAVLTADQFQKWQDMQSKMHNRPPGGPPPGGPPPIMKLYGSFIERVPPWSAGIRRFHGKLRSSPGALYAYRFPRFRHDPALQSGPSLK